MSKIFTGISLAVLCAALSATAWADTLIMKDGTSHDGQFVSGTSRVITFRENGEIRRFGIDDVDSLQFGPADPAPRNDASQGGYPDADRGYPSDTQAPARADQQVPDRQMADQGDAAPGDRNNPDARSDRPDRNDDRISDRNNDRNNDRNSDRYDAVIPSGTELAVRTSEAINSRTAQVDQTFDAQVDRDVLGDAGQVLIPRGADARLIIKRINNGGSTGTPDMTLDLESIGMDGRRYLIDASDVNEKGTSGIGNNKRTGEMVGGGAVLGTIIGAIAGGGKGAAIGAVGGAAAGGTAEVLTKGKDVRVPSETVLRFRLDHPVHLRPSK